MPLFVFISGYVSNVNSKRFFIGTFGIIETYIIYTLLFSYASIPSFHMWYLESLFVWRLIDYATRNINSIIIVSFALLAAILCGFVESIEYKFSLSRIIVFSFFYFFGRCCREKDIVSKIYKLPKFWGCSFIVITLIALLFITNLGRVVYCSQPYTILSSNIYIGCLIRVIFMIYSTFLCISIISCSKKYDFTCSVGKTTLPIYVYHIGLWLIFKTINNLINVPLSIITISIAAISFVYIIIYLSKFIKFNYLLHPITYYIEKNLSSNK